MSTLMMKRSTPTVRGVSINGLVFDSTFDSPLPSFVLNDPTAFVNGSRHPTPADCVPPV